MNIKYRALGEKKFWQVCPPWRVHCPAHQEGHLCRITQRIQAWQTTRRWVPLPAAVHHPRRCACLAAPPLQVKGAEKVLFGLDDVVGRGREPVFPGGLVAASDIVVVEGEMDKLALEEAGFTNVLSVSA